MRHLIVDGYNVIRSTPPYRELADRDDWELARSALIGDVAAYVSATDRATIVFDGTSNRLSTGEPSNCHGVQVIFSPYGKTADTVIERLVRQSSGCDREVVVVTSDAQTQWVVMGDNVVRRASREFHEHLTDAVQSDCANPLGTHSRVTLSERVSPAAREMLENLRRGKKHNAGD